MKKVIFTNDYWNLDTDMIIVNYCEANDININELSDYEKDNIINDEIVHWYEFEKMTLDYELDNDILAIADLGLWNGRTSGYKILSDNLNNILNVNGDVIEVYAENGNIRAKATHHDGTNYILFRKIRDDRDIDKLLDRLYEGKPVSPSLLNYYTESLYPQVGEIYGWE